ncbi:MAG TPA: hypothetical protein VMT35_15995 [Ignavibacteriaceae bacterium]|nr:hypothetical protein [Ignavibacteriaceae bacterium]
MKKYMQYIVLMIIVIILLTEVNCKKNPVIPPEEKPDTTSHEFRWEIDTIGEFQSTLYDVWGSEDDMYAVGLIYWPNRELPINIIHWDGEKWSPINYLEGSLINIYGFSDKDIWVCGSWQVDYDAYALISHWDGFFWKTWKFQEYNQLLSIWGTSSSNIYVCGWAGTILHYNGNTWEKLESNTTFNLRGIWGIDNSNIFISGNLTSTGEGILLKYDGISWRAIAHGGNQTDSTLYGEFRGVWCDKIEKIIHVGSLAYEGTEGNWTLSDIPYNRPIDNIIGLSAMQAIHGSKGNNVFVCGAYNLIIHWNGNSWNIYNQFFDKSKSSILFGLWTNEKSVFIVGGNENARAIIYRGYQ